MAQDNGKGIADDLATLDDIIGDTLATGDAMNTILDAQAEAGTLDPATQMEAQPPATGIVMHKPAGRFEHLKLLVYGDSGVGKTVFGSTAPDVLFLDAENGMMSVDREVARWPIQAWADLQAAFTYLINEPHPYKTVVIDSINEIQRIAMDNVLERFPTRRTYDSQPTMADWGKALDDVEHLFRFTKSLQMNVIFLAAAARKQYEEERIEPQLSGKQTATKLCRYMDAVGYLYVEQSDSGQLQRCLGFDLANYVVKDRTRLLPPIIYDPTWDKLTGYLQPAKTAGKRR